MRQIYEEADSVYAWLGVPFDEGETKLGVEKMRTFNGILRDALHANDEDIFAASMTISANDPTIYSLDNSSDCHKAWLGIMEMFNQHYWQRAWIYQEVTSRAPTRIYCGSHWFNKIHLAAAVYLGYHLAQFTDIERRYGLGIGLGGSAYAVSAFDRVREKNTSQNLLDLLGKFRKARSLDPRDKVYVPRGLAGDVSDDQIIPDYMKSFVSVYVDVVKYFLQQQGHELDILGHVVRPVDESTHIKSEATAQEYSIESVPTWAPDWRDRLVVWALSKRVHRPPKTVNGVAIIDAEGTNMRATDSVGCNQVESCLPKTYDLSWRSKSGRAFNAGGIDPPKVEIQGHQLLVKGLTIDFIESLSSIWEENGNDTTEVRSWAPALQGRIGPYQPSGEGMDIAFQRTVVADMRRATRTPEETCEWRGNSIDWSILEKRPEEMTLKQSIEKYHMQNALYIACFGRRLCHTEQGYMGLVPAAAKVGDTVSVFSGGSVCYTLRRVDNNTTTSNARLYQFIGESYIHGLMDGEAYIGDKESDSEILVLI